VTNRRVDPWRSAGPGFAAPERVVLVEGATDECAFLVLAVLEVEGRDFAILARDRDMAQQHADPPVLIFEYSVDARGAAVLTPLPDEETYEDVYHLFADLWDDAEP
jgi:hypothetical protein